MQSNSQNNNQNQDIVADLIQERFQNDVPSYYILRCIEGPFAGNFIYLNLTEEGEVIGSDPQQDYTLYIENAGLSPIHAKINYQQDENDEYSYIIQDMQSEKGTWIKARAGNFISIENDMIFRIEDQQYRKIILIQQLNGLLEQNQNIKQKIQKNIMLKHQKILKIQHQNLQMEEKEIFAKVRWSGAIINKRSELFEVRGMDKFGVDCSSNLEMYISFFQKKYFLYVSPKAPGQVYVKLLPGGRYKLQPDDIINMGQLDFQIQRFNTGMWCDRGTRITMEDRYQAQQNIYLSKYFSMSYFAVFDGHGGEQCSQFLCENFSEKFKENLNNDDCLDETNTFYEYISKKIVETVQGIDQEFFERQRQILQDNNYVDSGSAGIITFIFGNKIITSNTGDCRAILSRNGQAVQLSVDHKPYLESERERILNAGGTVDSGRVNKKLAVSRAFGDFVFKKEQTGDKDIIIATPDVRIWDIDFLQDEFIVMGCDGLFDIYSNQEIINMVRERLTEYPITEQDPQKVARQLCLDAVNQSKLQRRGSDNVSVIIILLTRGITSFEKMIIK
ncbi:hypothetical protein IMG5_185510 [Ichthyophthirius multifiliis]|uniref:protein-serine/threonine phosphatase n=1 Tax=Ichthyophthirius multifiliis TaxID=5932 RepID=G0R3H9_ICHMU|nr:hypothetical protein IMG5_185510 [Ichthyophthirius multifiliis]EGR27968.1 hypothetical protein IMG5_185510 [Ichthyophthirius multifiliis]|eukprot:XP_004027313.1 hypothetical protein IMG5_185510 [Ichthyophthirius multifiliis]